MNITTKYNITDKVYAVALRDKYDDVKCEMCDGKGYTEEDPYCPECDGYKTVGKKVGKYFEINVIKIFGIIITEKQTIYYQRINHKFLEENIELTVEEAHKEIEEYKKENEDVYFETVICDYSEE